MIFPNVSLVLPGLMSPMKYLVTTKTAVDGVITESTTETVWFRACIQPMPAREVHIKPEGQRTWNWSTLYTKQTLPPDALLEDTNGIQYRVLSLSDWSKGGYQKYDIVQGFQ